MQVSWVKNFSNNGGLIALDRLNLETVKTQGVYVIYLAGNPPRSVYVGKGDVAARLASHKDDRRFVTARGLGTLYVAFATVSAAEQEGVEKYLARLLPPLVGERHPEAVREILVNSPFAA